jgi:hypothetical protein
MRAALAILVLLAITPAHGASPYCALWPKSCQPAASVEPAPSVEVAPVVPPPAPVVAPPAPPQLPIARPHQTPHVQTRQPTRPKWKPAPKRPAALPDWCARIPKGTTMGQVEFAAPLWGVTLTDKNRQQARDCLASK